MEYALVPAGSPTSHDGEQSIAEHKHRGPETGFQSGSLPFLTELTARQSLALSIESPAPYLKHRLHSDSLYVPRRIYAASFILAQTLVTIYEEASVASGFKLGGGGRKQIAQP